MKEILALLLLFLSLFSKAQAWTPEEALQKFAKYPQERIFIQFDKGEYLAGENAYFKAYVFSGFKLSRISTNLYLEFLDQDKKTIQKDIYPIGIGIAEGSFAIPKNLPENVYYFRAYTSWMLNFDERFQFIHPIAVYNPTSKTRLVDQTIAWKASAHVEGGTLLDNTEAKVAVRLHSLGRLPLHWKGYLFEGSDSTHKLIEFTSLNEEIGAFAFVPVWGKQYGIKITDEEDNTKVIPLPTVMQEGVSFRTAHLPRGIGYRITTKGSTESHSFKVLAHIEGALLYSATVKGSNGAIDGIIPIDSLTKGLVHITLFDTQGKVAAERLCFAGQQTLVDPFPPIEFTKITAQKRALNQWDIPVDTLHPDLYTVVVSNATTPACNDTRSLVNTFWLGSLPTPPYKANGYFGPDDTNAASALDALLISERWQLFDWNKMRNGHTADFKYFPDYFISYEGRVVRGKKPVANKDISLLFKLKDFSKIYLPIHTDSAGRFRTKNLVFRDTAKVYFQLKDLKASSSNMKVDFTRIDHFVPYTSSLPIPCYTLTERNQGDPVPQRVQEYWMNFKKQEADDERYKMLEAVTVKARVRSQKEKLNKELSTPMFQSTYEIIFDFVNEHQDVGGEGILSWLHGRVPGTTYNGADLIIRDKPAQVFIDEILDADGTRLPTIPISEIAMVKVLRNAFALGGTAQAVAVYLKRAGMSSKPDNQDPEAPSTTLVGYPKGDIYKAVNYAEGGVESFQSDSRSVLYWNTWPEPEHGKARIQFYNNDISKKLRLIVIGFRADGTPFYLNKEISL